MKVDFNKDYKMFSDFKFGETLGGIHIKEFKEKFNKDFVLYTMLSLAASSRDQSLTKFWSNLDFIFDINQHELKRYINNFDYNAYPKDGEFYILIEFWGKVSIHKIYE